MKKLVFSIDIIRKHCVINLVHYPHGKNHETQSAKYERNNMPKRSSSIKPGSINSFHFRFCQLLQTQFVRMIRNWNKKFWIKTTQQVHKQTNARFCFILFALRLLTYYLISRSHVNMTVAFQSWKLISFYLYPSFVIRLFFKRWWQHWYQFTRVFVPVHLMPMLSGTARMRKSKKCNSYQIKSKIIRK